MPFLLPAAATAIAAAAPAAAAATAATAATTSIASTIATMALNAATSMAISAVMSALQPQVGAAGRVSEWTLDPDGPIPFAAGRVGVAGSAVHRKTFGPDLMYLGIASVLSGAGPIDGYEGFLADDETVAFDGAGKAITSQYAGELWVRQTLGTQPDTALPLPVGLKAGGTTFGFGAAHKMSGMAADLVIMGENSKGTAYPTGEVKRLRILRGLKGWDPRLDSTYPGGAGACRLDNPATWVYLTNPILWALKWSLGLWSGPIGKGAPQVDCQVGGIGAKLSGIDVPAFVAAANVADANGWTVAAYPTTDDDKAQVLDAFLQAGGAIYAERAGKISCIQRAAPRTSIVTITAADTEGPIQIDTAASRIDRINTIRPRFWSEPHHWQLTALPEVTDPAWRDEDGGTRPRGVDYPYVTDATQAAQLAALQIANTREGIAGVIPLKPYMQRIRPGDAFTINEAGFVLNGVKCLCLNTAYDPATGVVSVTFVSETDAKYPYALGQSPEVPEPPVLTPVDHTVTPPSDEDWALVSTVFIDGGVSIPALLLTGAVENARAQSVVFEYRPVGADEWAFAGAEDPTIVRKEISAVTAGTQYEVAISYRIGGLISDRLVLGPVTAGTLVAGDVSSTSPTLTDALNLQLDVLVSRTLATLLEQARAAAEAVDARDRFDVIGRVDPIDRTVVLRGDAIQASEGGLYLDDVNTRVGEGLTPDGDLARDIPLAIAESSNVANSQIELSATGELTAVGVGVLGQVTIPGLGVDAYVAGEVDALADAVMDGTVPVPVTPAIQAALDLKIDLSQKGAANGVATLDGSSKIPTSQLPALAITNTFVVNSQAAQLALTTQEGDVAVRTDQNKSYIRNAGVAGTMADWQELLTPTDAVLSVNGYTGAVTLVKGDVGLGAVDNVQQMPLSYLDTDGAFAANSDAKVPSQKAVKTAFGLKANLAGGNNWTGNQVNTGTFGATGHTALLEQLWGVLSDGVATLPHAQASGFGVIRVPLGRGLRIQSGDPAAAMPNTGANMLSFPAALSGTMAFGYRGVSFGDSSGGGVQIKLSSIGASDLALRAGDGNAARTADVVILVKNDIEVARFTDTGRFGVMTNAPSQALDVVGAIKSSPYTVAGLAGLPAPTAGTRSFVSDANATMAAGIGTVVAAGGANGVPVYYDGADWRIG